MRYWQYTPYGYTISIPSFFTAAVSASAPCIIFRRLYLYVFLR